MDIRELRYFLAVAEDLHFGKAAKRLNISQPPLSQAIRLMEESLGTLLFVRTSRSVRLTPAGQFLFEEARHILERLAVAEQSLKRMARGMMGTLNIGTVGPALEGPLPCSIRRFREQYPDITVNLYQHFTREQVKKIREGSLDLGIVRLFNQDVRDLNAAFYYRENYILALPEGHAKSKQDVVNLSELQDETFILFPRHGNPPLYDELIKSFRLAGFCPSCVHVSMDKHTTGALVAAGIGLALMPESFSGKARAGVIYRPIIGQLPDIEYSVVWNAERETPLMRNFLDAVLDCGKLSRVKESPKA